MLTWSMTQILGQEINNKNCLFGVTNIVKNTDKVKWVCNGYGIAFDGATSHSFDNDLVVTFGVDNIHHLILIIAQIIFYCQVKETFWY